MTYKEIAEWLAITLTTGVDTIVGTPGNDIINATNTAASVVLGGLDSIDGGAGTDTFNVADTATAAGAEFSLPTGFSVKNVEILNVTTNGNIGDVTAPNAFDVSAIAGVTKFTGVAAGNTLGSNIKAAATTDVSLTVAGAAAATIAGGKAVSVSAGTGAVSVVGNALTEVTVKGGNLNAANSIDNTATGTTLKAVTLDNIAAGAAANIRGGAIETLTLKNQDSGVGVAITDGTTKTLTVNVQNSGYDSTGAAVPGVTVAAGAAATTLNVNATGSKSNVTVNGAAAKTLNITGDAALVLATTTAFTKVDGSTATGNLTLGTLNAATANVSTGAGNDSFSLATTAKATVDTGAGNDTVTLTSAVAAGSTINLGAGDDKLLVNGGSVAPSATTTIDAGDGTDTVAAALINAANAAQFKNFENIDVSSATATALDVELMTGSTITGLTLTGGTGNATVNNVAAGVGLTVSGVNDGTIGNTTIGIKGAATGTADTFDITFAGTAASTATAAAPSAVDADKIVVANVETINVSSTGTGFVANTLGLTADKLQTLTITGDKALTLTFDGATGTNVVATGGAVKMIDGSVATGVLNIDTTNVVADNKVGVGLTVKAGSANDVITLAQAATVDAGAGNDTITSAAAGGTFTGGVGNDKFDVALAVATGTTEATSVLSTITDFAVGDSIVFGATATGAFNTTKVTLGAGVTNLDLALAAATGAANTTQWFQYGTNTYVVSDEGDGTFGAGDTVVKLTGLVDLSTASLDTLVLTLA